ITESTTFKKAEEPTTTIKSIKIIDQNGNIYFEKQYKTSENEVKIKISFLKKGSYFVVINYMETDEEVLPIYKN
ncbi:MAG: T9SS type A sorting domain-containing protein, partial [Bacteroidales bacterium]|nr:T9SS type A sorting domain-containing protein [Bacteroidales bacterium]